MRQIVFVSELDLLDPLKVRKQRHESFGLADQGLLRRSYSMNR
jgi:hypothetical protein